MGSLGITIPTNSDFAYSYTVDWGDGNTDTTTYTEDAGYEYAAAGSYTVSITGTFPSIYFDASFGSPRLINSRKIKTINQWGDNPWKSMNSAFQGCENLTIEAAAGNPVLSNVTDMESMFEEATAFNQDLSGWDVSKVTNMSSMFAFAYAFNRDLSGWDVSKVTNMWRMFSSADAFNQDISGWDVSKVTTMSFMLAYTAAFNRDLSGWDVSNVTDMESMFEEATAFNRDLGGWDVSNVTDMSGMFFGDTAFNQDLGGWDVSNVTDMSSMFDGVLLSIENYDALLRGWSALSLQTSVRFSVGSNKYCAESARNTLKDTHSWVITDGGKDTAENCARYQASFTFASPRLTKSVGDAAFTFTPTGGSGTGAITYASGDTTVASVSATSGEVTIAGVGSAIITATKAGDTTYNAATATYTLIVTKGEQAAFAFANPAVDKSVGDPVFTITPTDGPGSGAITWESSDPTVASVSATSGEVTIITAGMTTITATKAADSNYNEAMASYTLIVTKAEQAAFTFANLAVDKVCWRPGLYFYSDRWLRHRSDYLGIQRPHGRHRGHQHRISHHHQHRHNPHHRHQSRQYRL